MIWLIFLAWPCAASPVVVHRPVHGSIEATLQDIQPRHLGQALGEEVARLLRWRGSIRHDIHPGDQLTLIYEATTHGSDEPILQFLSYQGQEINLRAYRYPSEDGIFRYYDDAGHLIEPVIKNSPVKHYSQITDIVQNKQHGCRLHRGIDLKAHAGAEVRLPFAGVVTRKNWHTRQNGYCLEIRYHNGLIAHFLHLQKVHPQVTLNKTLPQHALLGWVGSSGHSNAPHLHYEILKNGQPLQPLTYNGQKSSQLTATALGGFNRQRMAWQAMIATSVPTKQPPLRQGLPLPQLSPIVAESTTSP